MQWTVGCAAHDAPGVALVEDVAECRPNAFGVQTSRGVCLVEQILTQLGVVLLGDLWLDPSG
jgi:hypothetical protein